MSGADDPWQAAFRAFVQRDGRPLAKLLRELLFRSQQTVAVPREVIAALVELLEPTSPTNLYRFLRPIEQFDSRKNVKHALIKAWDRRFQSEEAIAWKREREAADIERARLRPAMENKYGEGTAETAQALADFAKERDDRGALAAFSREARALAALKEMEKEARARSHAAVRLTRVKLTAEQCQLLERNVEIRIDMAQAMMAGLPDTKARGNVASKHGLTTKAIAKILKGPPGSPWRNER